MKNIFALVLIAGLLLGGCAKKAVVEEEATTEVAPVEAPAVVEQAPEPVEVAPPVVPEPKIEMAAAKVFFDFDSYLLTPASKAALQGNALWLRAQPEVRIVIEGHTDERGSSSYNLALGEKRAQAARSYLLNLGIAPERIKIVSYGKEKATTAAGSESVWSLDRRAEFVVNN
jgi:peptidoglycan-associated lipoprotein